MRDLKTYEYAYTYRFRADDMGQVDALKELLQGAVFETVLVVETPPDVEVWMHTDMKLHEVLKAMASLGDNEVLRETINYLELYTGDRIYVRGEGDWNGGLFE